MSKKAWSVIFLASAMFWVGVAIGCKDADRAQFRALGSEHRIIVYSGGIAVATYESTGNVSNESSSDGWYFKDKASGKLIEVAGTLVILQD